MPHLVEMHKKYAKQGLVVVTVALDDASNEKLKASLLKFLRNVDATFPNLVLDETEDVWTKKLGIDGYPAMFVFNRAGKYKKLLAPDIDDELANVEKLVVEWLK